MKTGMTSLVLENGLCLMAIQQNNTRKNHLITYKGETKTLAQWIVCLGLTRGALNNRLKHNWSIEEALSKPVKIYKERRK